MTDKRPDPKPRKRPQLWQAYLAWDELVQLRKRHLLRISSIEAEKSNLDATFEYGFLKATAIDKFIDDYKKTMINYGESIGPIWGWLTSIRGLGEGSLAAQLLAQIDDIAKFDTVSKLWRFAGKAVIDGKAEKNQRGEKAHYNARLKSICYLVSDQFIKQRTPVYRDIYDEEKAHLHEIHPERIKNGNDKWMYNDGHLDMMARRKAEKIFLQHLWLLWRQSENLPISEPYVQAILGHTHIIPPEG